MLTRLTGGALAALSLTLAACGSQADIEAPAGVEDRSGDPLAEVIGETGDFSMLASGFEQTGLDGVLEGGASYTVFAPRDAAFEALGADAATLLDSEESGAILAAVLREHMVPGALTPEAIRTAIEEAGGSVTMTSLGSGEITLSLDGDRLVAGLADGQEAMLGDDAIVASNGVVIPVDGLLVDVSAIGGEAAE